MQMANRHMERFSILLCQQKKLIEGMINCYPLPIDLEQERQITGIGEDVETLKLP